MAIRHQSVSVLLLVVILPAAAALVDNVVLRSVATHNRVGESEVILYPLLVCQVAILSFVAGRFVEPALLRWTLYVWALVLVDLILFAVMLTEAQRWNSPLYASGYALLSSQMNLVVVWTVLGSTPWTWRLPLLLVTGAFVAFLACSIAAEDGWTAYVWPTILLFQNLMVLLATVTMLFCGIRIRHLNPHGSGLHRQALRFSLFHLLVWTTAASIILLLTKGMDVYVLYGLKRPELFPTVAIATALCAGSVVALWSALGRGHVAVRFSVLLATALGTGWWLKWMATGWAKAPQWSYPLLRIAGELDSLWITWCVLAACFLGALLLVFRASGYRLTHVPAAT